MTEEMNQEQRPLNNTETQTSVDKLDFQGSLLEDKSFPPNHALLLNSPKEIKLISLPLVIILVGFIFYLVGYSIPISNIFTHTEKIVEQVDKDFFSSLYLEAKAVFVYDVVKDEVLYAYGEDEILPLASLTKLMSVVISRESLPSDTVITINANDIQAQGDTGLLVGERWKLGDIIRFTLMTSSNDGASALASAAGSLGQNAYTVSNEDARLNFIQKMNVKAQELKLRGTYFFNGTGLDVDGEISGGYGTAKDVSHLMKYALFTIYDDMSITSLLRTNISSLANIRHTSTNTNESINIIPNIIASKTGFTDLAGGNLVIAFDAGIMRPVIISVLGSTHAGRFTDVEKLSWAALQTLAD